MPNFVSDHQAIIPTWSAADHGLLAWEFDPAVASGTYTLATAGTLYVTALKALPGLVTNVVYQVTTAGATLTTSQCFVGLYQDGVLLSTSADQSTPWLSTGLKTTALASPVNVDQGVVYAAFLFNGTTGPTLAAGAGITGVNAGIGATSSRFGTAATSQTSLPASVGTIAALAKSPWVALS